MKRILKTVAARLPGPWQQEMKRRYFGRQIRNRKFRTDEPEFERLSSMVSKGDWAIDVGANIGHYTLRLAELVGERGRVVAFEPIPATFELLAANVASAPGSNVTLINAAASDSARIARMTIPKFDDTQLDNFYMAHLDERSAGGGLDVLCVSVDSLALPHPIRLVKIDAEGHELSVLQGMEKTLRRDLPTLIVEDNTPEITRFLSGLGYLSRKLSGSSNLIFTPAGNE